MYTVLASVFSGTNQRTSFITGLRYALFFQLIYIFFDPINSLRAGFYKFVELFFVICWFLKLLRTVIILKAQKKKFLLFLKKHTLLYYIVIVRQKNKTYQCSC